MSWIEGEDREDNDKKKTGRRKDFGVKEVQKYFMLKQFQLHSLSIGIWIMLCVCVCFHKEWEFELHRRYYIKHI